MRRTSLLVTSPALLAIVTVLAACGDPAYRIHASVKTAAPCGAPGAGGAPIADANVALVCGEDTTILGKTDAEGHVWITKAGMLDRDCAVAVVKDGMTPRLYPVRALCNSSDEVMQCKGVTVTADLAPSAP